MRKSKKTTPAPKLSAKDKTEALAKAKNIDALKLRLREKGQIPEIGALIANLIAVHQAEKQNAVYAIEARSAWELSNCLPTLRANTNRLTKAIGALYNNAIMDNNAILDLMRDTGMDTMLKEYDQKQTNEKTTAEAVGVSAEK